MKFKNRGGQAKNVGKREEGERYEEEEERYDEEKEWPHSFGHFIIENGKTFCVKGA